MFGRDAEYPIAVTSHDDVGLKAAFAWCVKHMENGDHITVWTHLKGNLSNNRTLEQFVSRHRDVEHVTARGGAHLQNRGPVLMAWADMKDIAEFVQYNGPRIRALCVVSWNEKNLSPWVTAVQPELLGDTSQWDEQTPPLDPIVEEAMKGITLTINHNNTISAGYEKDDVVSALLALHDAGYSLPGSALAGWAIAHGWAGGNPDKLQQYATDINNGKRPRIRRSLRADYVEYLRTKVASKNDEDWDS